MFQAVVAIIILVLILGIVFMFMQPFLEQARHDRIMERLNLERERTTQIQFFTQSMMVIGVAMCAMFGLFGLSYLLAYVLLALFGILAMRQQSRDELLFAAAQNRQALPPPVEVRVLVPHSDPRSNWEIYQELISGGKVAPEERVVFERQADVKMIGVDR